MTRVVMANPACVSDPSHQHHSHDIPVTLSGTTWAALDGSGLIQQERPWIASELRWHRVGFGGQLRGDLSRDDAEELYGTLRSYGLMFTGGGFDRHDYQTPREGRACLRDARALRAMIDRNR